MANIYKVLNVMDNNSYDNDRLQAGLVLNYCNPLVSLPFLEKRLSLKNKNKLGEMAGISFSNDECYNKNGDFIDDNMIVMTIADELFMSAKRSLETEGDSGYFLANYVKEVIENKVLSRLKEKEEENITVDDLMAKLYGVNEEKGMVR